MIGTTAVVLIDPYNDFLHPDGKLYPSVSESLEVTNSIEHLKELVKAARDTSIPIYYGLHQQFKDGNYAGWQHMNEPQTRTRNGKVFEEGSFGSQIYEGLEPQLSNGDVTVSKHWNSRLVPPGVYLGAMANLTSHSSFANTDLDYQLRQRNIAHLVLAGMTTNTCLESTAREPS
jgi:nicotinamidase-related amidase